MTRHTFISCCPFSLPLDHYAFPPGRLLLHSDLALQEGFPSLFLRPGPVDGKEPGHSDTFSKALQDRHGLWWLREERRYDPLIWEAFQRGCPLQSLDIETRTGHHSLDSQVMIQSTIKPLRHPQTGPMEAKTKTGFQHKSLKCSSLLGHPLQHSWSLPAPVCRSLGTGTTYWTPTEQHSTWILTFFSLTSASLSTCQNTSKQLCLRMYIGPLRSIEPLLLQDCFLYLQPSHQERFMSPWTRPCSSVDLLKHFNLEMEGLLHYLCGDLVVTYLTFSFPFLSQWPCACQIALMVITALRT